jgi:hypothetical protein
MRFQNSGENSTLGFNRARNSTLLFGHIGDEISKNREKKVHWVSKGASNSV